MRDKNTKKKLNNFAAGASGACIAVIKTRLQLQGELQKKDVSPRVYKNVLQGLYIIYKNEGIRGVQKGLIPAYGYQFIMNGCRFGFYDLFKTYLHKFGKKINLINGDSVVPLNIISGASAGLIGACLGSPLFLVKTRLQSFSPSMPQIGVQHQYKGFADALRSIHKNEGVKGLYRGAYASMLRTAVGSAVQLSTYDLVKNHLISDLGFNDNYIAHMSSSLISSFFVCLAMNPFDVVTTRTYNMNSVSKSKVYKNLSDVFISAIKIEGFGALFKGVTAHYFRIGYLVKSYI